MTSTNTYNSNNLANNLINICQEITQFPPNDYIIKIKRYVSYVRRHSIPRQQHGHNHHIIPRCLGGSDHKLNMVRLTKKTHLNAHQMLSDIFTRHQGLYNAVLLLSGTKDIIDYEIDDNEICLVDNNGYDQELLYSVLTDNGWQYDSVIRKFI